MAAMDTPRSNYPVRPVARVNERVETDTILIARREISWGAILAGVVVTVVAQIALNMLGMAIGASTINPISERNPIEPGFGTAAVLWFAGTGLLALFAGGWTAAYLTDTYSHGNGLLHGLVTWAVSTLLVFTLVASGLGNLINGLTGAIGQGVSILTQGAIQTIPEVADSISLSGQTSDAIGAELRGLLQGNTVTTDEGEAGTDTTTGETTGAIGATFNSLEEIEFNNRVFNYLNGTQDDPASRDELVAFISERTGLTTEEANAQLDRWTTAFNQVRDDAEQTARQVGEQLTNTLATIGGALFLLMLLGAVAASVGGLVGTRDLPEEMQATTTVRE